MNKKQDDIAFKLLLSTLNNYKTRIEKLEKEKGDLNSSIHHLTTAIRALRNIAEYQSAEISILMKKVCV